MNSNEACFCHSYTDRELLILYPIVVLFYLHVESYHALSSNTCVPYKLIFILLKFWKIYKFDFVFLSKTPYDP